MPNFIAEQSKTGGLLLKTLWSTFLVFLIMLFFNSASAQGDLLLSPRRIVFEGTRKTQELNLANTGKDTARFLISMVEIKMNEDGTFKVLDTLDPAGHYATPYLRFFPRSVTLAPYEAQTVKVQVVNGGELTQGEYRSHMYFRAVPETKALGDSSAKKNDKSISVTLKAVIGISIPVIIRIGENETKAAFTDINFNNDQKDPKVQMAFTRSGSMSVYGDLSVDHISPDGKITQVGIAKGIAVYTPIQKRNFSIPLDHTAKVDYGKGKLRFVYTDQSQKANKIAEEVLELN